MRMKLNLLFECRVNNMSNKYFRRDTKNSRTWNLNFYLRDYDAKNQYEIFNEMNADLAVNLLKKKYEFRLFPLT